VTQMARAFDLGTRRRRFAMSSRKVYLSTEVADGSLYRALKERTKRLKDGDELETA
jgi:hypothetical protein